MSHLDTKFHVLPTHAVISVFATKAAVDSLLTDLKAAGFDDDKIQQRYGAEGLQLVDPDGSHHGFWAKILRGYQRLSGMEARLLDEVETALKANQYALRVDTDSSEAQQSAVLTAMLAHTDKSVFYVGHGTITVLHVGKNYYNAQADG
ncbi:MAG: hypothetical protein NT075_37155 [Chloroflexi bacterium]|nr:hypothetical protein [Chloroflexota bacterium]